MRTSTIVAAQANAPMLAIHDRMPVVLPREAWAEWLDPANDDVEDLVSLLRPAPGGVLERHPVGPAVGNVANDGPHLVEPVPEEAPDLFSAC